MQRTTENTIITYAKITINKGTPEVTTAKQKIAEKDPEKAVKIFRKTNTHDSIITVESCTEIGFIHDDVWYLLEAPTKELARLTARAIKAVENELLELVHGKMAELAAEAETEEEAGE